MVGIWGISDMCFADYFDNFLFFKSSPFLEKDEGRRMLEESGEGKQASKTSFAERKFSRFRCERNHDIFFRILCIGTDQFVGRRYLVLHRGLAEDEQRNFRLFLGNLGGRFISGFLTMKFNDKQMIWLGEGITLVGVVVLFLPFGEAAHYCL